MDECKKDIFRIDYPGESFPSYRSLGKSECELIRGSVAENMGFQCDPNPLELVRAMRARLRTVVGDVSDRESFDFSDLLQSLDVSPPERVLINWNRFDEVDEMSLVDLCDRFGAIWWPGPDDITLFDDSLKWFLEIEHSGKIGFLRP